MNDTKERTDCFPIPDCPQRFYSPEPDRDKRGSEGRKKQGYGLFTAGTERFCSLPPYREIIAVKVANQGRDVACLFQPAYIR
jgi:hypothetical protein